ncbi:MAG: 3-phosphoshikimate 1-carboxyvinyltransferase [Dysgonamonadaceae bacterium]|jgi:3-phosphoshikimate 1-carboxyvinyltransferase|nr:3-phosphoshikimate 1-carboxyvinyltransferase [Dysgonamonadaceae bacterium]
MSSIQIQPPSSVGVNIQLPASKSISNRVLILNALAGSNYTIENLSDSDDTKVLVNALKFSSGKHIDIGAAGTSMRFLTAFLSLKEGERVITGSERMKNRPIKILVDALRTLGADIDYTEKEGFPPLKIKGTQLRGGSVVLNGDVSSQYISALMMIAPALKEGLHLHLIGEIISEPYLQMTLSLMIDFGVNAVRKNREITIRPQTYKAGPFRIESDWSAASYWYEIAALSDKAEIKLPGLRRNSCQGDNKVRELFEHFGVETEFTNTGVVLRKKSILPNTESFNYNFANEPDLAQTLAVTCCLLNIPFRFTGLQTLKIKETDRIRALQNELEKLGYLLRDENNHTLIWNGETIPAQENPIISTYDDHRMAMAFAPACLKLKKIQILHPEVVTKSYPGYWNDLALAGFQTTNPA